MRQDVESTVRERVTALFRSRPGLTQRELADAIGVDPSWVSAFFKGSRHANDLTLLMKIARYFGVTVGYLLNETDRGRDAGAATLLTTWDALQPPDREVVLNLALGLRRRDGARDAAPLGAPDVVPPSGGSRNQPAGATVHGKKHQRR